MPTWYVNHTALPQITVRWKTSCQDTWGWIQQLTASVTWCRSLEASLPLPVGEVCAACYPGLFPLLRKERKAVSLTCTLKQLRGSCRSLSSPHFFFSIVIWLAFVREILISYQKGMTSVAAHHLQGQVQTQSLPLSLTLTTFGLSLQVLINMESDGGWRW